MTDTFAITLAEVLATFTDAQLAGVVGECARSYANDPNETVALIKRIALEEMGRRVADQIILEDLEA